MRRPEPARPRYQTFDLAQGPDGADRFRRKVFLNAE
jgi:hypothetical protein